MLWVYVSLVRADISVYRSAAPFHRPSRRYYHCRFEFPGRKWPRPSGTDDRVTSWRKRQIDRVASPSVVYSSLPSSFNSSLSFKLPLDSFSHKLEIKRYRSPTSSSVPIGLNSLSLLIGSSSVFVHLLRLYLLEVKARYTVFWLSLQAPSVILAMWVRIRIELSWFFDSYEKLIRRRRSPARSSRTLPVFQKRSSTRRSHVLVFTKME